MGNDAKRVSVSVLHAFGASKVAFPQRKTLIIPRDGLRLVFCEDLTFKTWQGNRTVRPINVDILAPLTRGSMWVTDAMAEQVGFATVPGGGSSRSAFVSNLVPDTFLAVGQYHHSLLGGL